jgi:DNA-binding NarL/FixJ family response regulator
MTVRVLVVDDHPMVRDGLAALLGSVPGVEVVGFGDSGEAAVTLADELDPDLVVMDVSMAGIGGLAATKRIVEGGVRVLILTMLEDPGTLVAAFQVGASGYLSKSSGRAEVAAAIQAVHAGQLVVGSALSDAARSLLARGEVGGRGEFPELSARQFEVLRGLARGLDNAAIAAELDVTSKTVANTVSELLTRLQVPTRVAAAAAARERGLGV